MDSGNVLLFVCLLFGKRKKKKETETSGSAFVHKLNYQSMPPSDS
jgi:hypothetical protein